MSNLMQSCNIPNIDAMATKDFNAPAETVHAVKTKQSNKDPGHFKIVSK